LAGKFEPLWDPGCTHSAVRPVSLPVRFREFGAHYAFLRELRENYRVLSYDLSEELREAAAGSSKLVTTSIATVLRERLRPGVFNSGLRQHIVRSLIVAPRRERGAAINIGQSPPCLNDPGGPSHNQPVRFVADCFPCHDPAELFFLQIVWARPSRALEIVYAGIRQPSKKFGLTHQPLEEIRCAPAARRLTPGALDPARIISQGLLRREDRVLLLLRPELHPLADLAEHLRRAGRLPVLPRRRRRHHAGAEVGGARRGDRVFGVHPALGLHLHRLLGAHRVGARVRVGRWGVVRLAGACPWPHATPNTSG
jgi:hypothetical protein